ncbi:hypothetical protein GHT06_010994 [Daphnia sinensis]|uniref:Uncharacterized protein n=1 Tax=Daphnia sinensis TaxID=1820382 RepID=A0AAD5LIW2_9CRUS|nr:hypothetical protein GHT06_010994 [Daphnia sinensis]
MQIEGYVCILIALMSSVVAVRFYIPEVKAPMTGQGRIHDAGNGLAAYLPERYTPMPWALRQRGLTAPNVVAAYLPDQYGSIRWTPWALPARLNDPPKIASAYLPDQHSTMSWRLPLQLRERTGRSAHEVSPAYDRGALTVMPVSFTREIQTMPDQKNLETLPNDGLSRSK